VYRGRIEEWGECAQITERPEHPYTQRLLLAAPVADPIRQARRRDRWLAARSNTIPQPR
jgi:peptide/nickel transport system ATP-binding protein